MSLKPAGYTWLKQHFKLNRHVLTHNSYIGNNSSIGLTSKGNIEQVYSIRYDPGNTPAQHIEFALKYDDFNPDFLQEVFQLMQEAEVVAFIEHVPSGKYARKIGFLYEFLTGKQLSIQKTISGNYIDLLEPDKYITSKGTKNQRWRINDNLLGTPAYCPVVRRTKELQELLQKNVPEELEQLRTDFSPETFTRATGYLYRKETRSSYEIEKEQPSPDRIERFVTLLMQAGTEPEEKLLEEKRLVQLQNAILDPRFAASGFRDFQNYIGQSLPNFQDLIHYICPPPGMVPSLMKGLHDMALKTVGIAPEIRAAIVAFGFVFIHPFEDGNGRIHRFLIHDVLTLDKLVPQGMIIPVSAHMLNHRRDYDHILEVYSKPLMQLVRYTMHANGELVITNPDQLQGYFRYPDLTDQCIYLARVLHATLLEDMKDELLFLQRYDDAKTEIQKIVDMPDRLLNLMILFLHQNKGMFPKKRREDFHQLTNEEIQRIQDAYRKVFELDI